MHAVGAWRSGYAHVGFLDDGCDRGVCVVLVDQGVEHRAAGDSVDEVLEPVSIFGAMVINIVEALHGESVWILL